MIYLSMTDITDSQRGRVKGILCDKLLNLQSGKLLQKRRKLHIWRKFEGHLLLDLSFLCWDFTCFISGVLGDFVNE